MTGEQKTPDDVPLDVQNGCRNFLYEEAETLDNFEFERWLEEFLAEDIQYVVPLRTTREWGSNRSEFSDRTFHFNEDFGSLQARVNRFATENAWSENPPSRIRRHVNAVTVEERVDDDEFAVRSNVLVFRGKRDDVDSELVSARRQDRLRGVDDGFEVADRRVLLDHTHVETNDFGFFL